jgi:hypothetical protein
MADIVTTICMDIYRKLEKSIVMNIIERLQICNILEICFRIIYNENMSKIYIYKSSHPFFLVTSVLNAVDVRIKLVGTLLAIVNLELVVNDLVISIRH